MPGGSLQSTERGYHGLGAADFQAVDYVGDFHPQHSARHPNGDALLARRKSRNFLYRQDVAPGRATEDFFNFAMEQLAAGAGKLSCHHR